MRRALLATFRRELVLRLRGGGWAASLGLFLVTAGMLPLALGRDPDLLAQTAPAVLWVAAAFALLIGLDGLYEEDLRRGSLRVYRLSPLPLSVVVLTKILAAWLVGAVPLIVSAPFILGAFGTAEPVRGSLGFLLGTPGLALLTGAIGAIAAGLRRGTALVVFLTLPILAPVFVFGPAAAGGGGDGVPLLILAAYSLQALALAPFIAAAALRAQER